MHVYLLEIKNALNPIIPQGLRQNIRGEHPLRIPDRGGEIGHHGIMTGARAAAIAALAAFAALAIGCGPRRAPGGMESYLPADTLAVAGVRLDRLRASPLYPKLPPVAGAMLAPLHEASYVLVAVSGKYLVEIARGNFTQAPPGAVLVDRTLALGGSQAAVRAALAQHRAGGAAPTDLLAHAGNGTIWIVARGAATLPVTGNAANLNRLIHETEFAATDLTLARQVTFEFTGFCRTPDRARVFEENLRAIFSLAAAAVRQPDLAAVLQSADVRRDNMTVHATLSAGDDAAARLLDLAAK